MGKKLLKVIGFEKVNRAANLIENYYGMIWKPMHRLRVGKNGRARGYEYVPETKGKIEGIPVEVKLFTDSPVMDISYDDVPKALETINEALFGKINL